MKGRRRFGFDSDREGEEEEDEGDADEEQDEEDEEDEEATRGSVAATSIDGFRGSVRSRWFVSGFVSLPSQSAVKLASIQC